MSVKKLLLNALLAGAYVGGTLLYTTDKLDKAALVGILIFAARAALGYLLEAVGKPLPPDA